MFLAELGVFVCGWLLVAAVAAGWCSQPLWKPALAGAAGAIGGLMIFSALFPPVYGYGMAHDGGGDAAGDTAGDAGGGDFGGGDFSGGFDFGGF